MLTAGVIGLGVGESHLQVLDSHPLCRVLKVYDFSEEVSRIAKLKYPHIEFVLDEDEIFNDNNIDMVSIASYDNFHFQQILKGIDNKKHLFVEKPIVQKKEEAEIILSKLKKDNDIIFSSNLILRQYGQFQELMRLIDDGEMGEISYIYASYNYGRIKKITEGWRGQIDYYSVVLGGGIHLIDLILWLTGKKVDSVYAIGNNIQSKNSKFIYNDLVVAQIVFIDGTIATINSNFGGVTSHYHYLEMYGTKKTFINDFNGYTIFSHRDTKNTICNNLIQHETAGISKLPQRKSVPKSVNKGFYLNHFIDSILHKKQPPVTIKEIFDVMAVCFAIEESQNSGKKVKVDYSFKK